MLPSLEGAQVNGLWYWRLTESQDWPQILVGNHVNIHFERHVNIDVCLINTTQL